VEQRENAMRNMMVFEEADGSLVAGSVTDVKSDGCGGFTIWYGYMYLGQPYFGKLDFKGPSATSTWSDQCVLTAGQPPKGGKTTGRSVFSIHGTAGSGPIVLDGWWEGPPLVRGKGARLSWTLRFEHP
jgi:hypothetical protein